MTVLKETYIITSITVGSIITSITVCPLGG